MKNFFLFKTIVYTVILSFIDTTEKILLFKITIYTVTLNVTDTRKEFPFI